MKLMPVPVLALLFATPLPGASLPDEARRIVGDLVACGTRHSLSSWTDPKRGAGCGRDVILTKLTAIAVRNGGKLRIVLDKFETSGPRTRNVAVPMENVYAILEGADPARRKTAYVVSGHFDSMGSDVMKPDLDAPGADDDASGVAASVLTCQTLAASAPRATLVFAAVSGEEQGLLGARRMKEWLSEQGYRVGGMITNDIVGATNGSKDRRPRLFSDSGTGDGLDSPGREMARLAEELVSRERVRLVFRRDRFGRGGDHLPFAEAGLPAIRFTEPLEDYRHQHQTPRTENGESYGDLLDHLDFPFLADVVAVNAALLGELSQAPAPPRAVTLGGVVTSSAKLTIDADDDADRKGFEVLRRETTDARWTSLTSAEKPGLVTLEGVSTDNDYFAVRSIGKNGRKSLAVPAVAAPRPPVGTAASVPSPTSGPK